MASRTSPFPTMPTMPARGGSPPTSTCSTTSCSGRWSAMRSAVFEAGSEIQRYFELLPPSPVRDLYERMQATDDPLERKRLQDELRQFVDARAHRREHHDQARPRSRPARPQAARALQRRPERAAWLHEQQGERVGGAVGGHEPPPVRLHGRVRRVLSRRRGRPAQARRPEGERLPLGADPGQAAGEAGLHVSEFRVESGLNCGGHAFGGKGQLLGPILDEFRRERANLGERPGQGAPPGPGGARP